MRYQANCGASSYKVLASVYYDAQGAIVSSNSYEPALTKAHVAPPETVIEGILETACSRP